MVKTKWVYGEIEASDGHRILVMRYWPRGRSRERLKILEWARELSPSKTLLAKWKVGTMPWEEYTQQFITEMTAQEKKIEELACLANSTTITLLCNERDDDPHCHRYILKNMIEQCQKNLKNLK